MKRSSDFEFYKWLRKQTASSVDGIYTIRRGAPKFRIGIFAGTHAKELLTGLSVIRWIHDNQDKLENVLVHCVVSSLLGADLFFSTQDWGARKRDLRFTPYGRDMNRLPADLATLAESGIYEWERVAELRKALDNQLDYVVDFHSTDGKSQPAGLGIVGGQKETDNVFSRLSPITTVYTDVTATQAVKGTKTRPHGAAYNPTMALEVECGQTGDEHAAKTAVTIFEEFARYLGVVSGDVPSFNPKKTYRVVDSVMAPDVSYAVADEAFLNEHAPVTKGQVLLCNKDGKTIESPCDAELIWCPSELVLTPSDAASEVWFLVQPAK